MKQAFRYWTVRLQLFEAGRRRMMKALQHYWQFWTVRVSVASSFVFGFLGVWNMLPIQLQRILPDWLETTIAAVLFLNNFALLPWLRARNAPRPQ